MKHKLVVSDRAKRERDHAFDWYRANFSNEYAARWYTGISKAVVSLADNPFIGHLAAENDRFPFELYELLYGKRRNKHRILYTVENDAVVILHIRHSAQNELMEDDL
jgi:plasmid stabilization system protein ParE